MAKLQFKPSGFQVECFSGQTIFEVGWKTTAEIQSACVGKGTCGLCRVVIVEGADQLSPYNKTEEKHLGNLYHLTKLRLSCQCTILEGATDIVVEVKKRRKKPRG